MGGGGLILPRLSAYPFIQIDLFYGPLPLARDDAGARFPAARRGEGNRTERNCGTLRFQLRTQDRTGHRSPAVVAFRPGDRLGRHIIFHATKRFASKLGMLLPLALAWHVF